MPAYLIASTSSLTRRSSTNKELKFSYPMIVRHGGRYLTKGGSDKLPEGGHWKPERVVIIEFPDLDSLDRRYNSPEYQLLIALRKACTSELDMLFMLEGA